jgi:hypothetical protein
VSGPEGGSAASTPSRGSLGALWRRAASAAPGFGPFSLPRAVRWSGLSPGRRLHRRPEPLGVIELTHLVALVPSTFSHPSDPHLRPRPDAGAAAPSRVCSDARPGPRSLGSLRTREMAGRRSSREAGGRKLLLAAGDCCHAAGGGALREEAAAGGGRKEEEVCCCCCCWRRAGEGGARAGLICVMAPPGGGPATRPVRTGCGRRRRTAPGRRRWSVYTYSQRAAWVHGGKVRCTS